MDLEGEGLKLSNCSSLNCTKHDCDYCAYCSHAIFKGTVILNNKKSYFSFNPHYGIQWETATGQVKKFQPPEDSPLWVLWEDWYRTMFVPYREARRSGKR